MRKTKNTNLAANLNTQIQLSCPKSMLLQICNRFDLIGNAYLHGIHQKKGKCCWFQFPSIISILSYRIGSRLRSINGDHSIAPMLMDRCSVNVLLHQHNCCPEFRSHNNGNGRRLFQRLQIHSNQRFRWLWGTCAQ